MILLLLLTTMIEARTPLELNDKKVLLEQSTTDVVQRLYDMAYATDYMVIDDIDILSAYPFTLKIGNSEFQSLDEPEGYRLPIPITSVEGESHTEREHTTTITINAITGNCDDIAKDIQKAFVDSSVFCNYKQRRIEVDSPYHPTTINIDYTIESADTECLLGDKMWGYSTWDYSNIFSLLDQIGQVNYKNYEYDKWMVNMQVNDMIIPMCMRDKDGDSMRYTTHEYNNRVFISRTERPTVRILPKSVSIAQNNYEYPSNIQIF